MGIVVGPGERKVGNCEGGRKEGLGPWRAWRMESVDR